MLLIHITLIAHVTPPYQCHYNDLSVGVSVFLRSRKTNAGVCKLGFVWPNFYLLLLLAHILCATQQGRYCISKFAPPPPPTGNKQHRPASTQWKRPSPSKLYVPLNSHVKTCLNKMTRSLTTATVVTVIFHWTITIDHGPSQKSYCWLKTVI